jgi:hypothetical protein
MSFRPRHAVFLAAALALPAVAFFGPGSRQKAPTASSVAAFSAASVYGSAAPSAPLEPAALPRLAFVFDCQSFAPASAKVCAALPADEQALLDLVNGYRMPPPMAWSHALAQRVEPAFDAAAQWDPRKLAPLERAALQNAVLELLAKSSLYEKDEHLPKIAPKGRALLKKFALSPAEQAALPASTGAVSEWLGEGTDWLQGVDKSSMHTASEGYARAHRQLQNGGTVADIVRMVLVDEKGAPYVSDIVQRVVIRRADADAVHVCIAELDPLSASCSTPGALRALDPVRGAGLVKPLLGAPCTLCHTNNIPKTAPFGPTTGFAVSSASVSRIKLSLERALRP